MQHLCMYKIGSARTPLLRAAVCKFVASLSDFSFCDDMHEPHWQTRTSCKRKAHACGRRSRETAVTTN